METKGRRRVRLSFANFFAQMRGGVDQIIGVGTSGGKDRRNNHLVVRNSSVVDDHSGGNLDTNLAA